MQRAPIALALAAGLTFSGAATLTPPVISTASAQAALATSLRDLSVQDKQRVVAQAVAEMINDYRVTQGLTPLFVHVDLSDFSERWSRTNADASGPGFLSGGHSSQATSAYYSGEIVMAETTPGRKQASQLNDGDWAALAQMAFNAWRNSPSHNDSMLDETHQGMGVGIVVDKQAVFATTVFTRDQVFIDGGPNRIPVGSWPSVRDSMQQAYVPTGALEILGLGGWRAPRDPSGKRRMANLSEDQVILGGPLDRTKGLPRKSDPRLSRSLPEGRGGKFAPSGGGAGAPSFDPSPVVDAVSSKIQLSDGAATALAVVFIVLGLVATYGPQVAQMLGVARPL